MRALAALMVLVAGCGVELEHGLDERQANQVAALLEGAGIAADKIADEQSGAYKIVVGRAESARAFALLEARDLPRRGQKGLAETFAESSLMPTAIEERARYAAALGAELERTVEGLPGVVAARVHLALPVEDPLAGQATHARPTAAVLVRTHGPGPGPADADVRRLVAAAVPALAADDVSVVIAPAASTADTPPPLDRFGPLRVAHDSRATLAALAGSGLVVILLLSVGLLLASMRLGALRRRLRDLEKR